MRAVLYLRVSTDEQTVENQRRELLTLAQHRGWTVTGEYADEGISGAKGRDKRPGFNQMMLDAARRKFDIVVVWAVDRLGRSTATVAAALAELDHVGVKFFANKEGMDSSTPHGRAMLQMASVFAELERSMIRERVNAGLARAVADGVKLGPKTLERKDPARYGKVRALLRAGKTYWQAAAETKTGIGTVRKIKAEMELENSEKGLSGILCGIDESFTP